MEQSAKYCGIHKNGEPLTANELNARQPLTIVRVAQDLAKIGSPLLEKATTEERDEFEALLTQTLITPHGDPEIEWQEFKRHCEDQTKIIRALFNNTIGFEILILFRNHMASILGDGTREVGRPVESLECELESYSEDFVQILVELSDVAAHEHAPSALLDIAGTLETHIKILGISGQARSLVGSLTPQIDLNQHFMDYELTSNTLYYNRGSIRRSVV